MKKFVLPAFIFLFSIQVMAQSETELKTKSISIFKDGKSFVIKEGKVNTTNNMYTLQKLPNALFGTLWFVGLESDIVQVTSKQEQVNEPIERKATNFTDLLYANKGKQLTITTHDDKVYTGIVEDFDLPEVTNSILQLKENEISEKYGSTDYRIFPPIDAPMLLIKMNSKWVSIFPSSIKAIEFSDKPETVAKLNIKMRKPLIKVQFAKSGSQPLSMMYLQNGISWTPTYLLELTSETEANLKLQAEVANNSEDIANTNINFVVGVPNFKFANDVATLTSFAAQINRMVNYDYGMRKGNMFSNAQIADFAYTETEEVENTDITADASEDFYCYNVNNITLEKGARAHYPLFSTPVKIKHLYECNLSAQDERNYRSYSGESQYSFDVKRCNVFHSIEIKNDSKNPFTTGSVMIVDAKTQRPLAEDLIKYTAIGQKSSIQLTQSPDIRVEEQEKIVNIQQQAKKRNGYHYNLVTIESEITIINSKKQDIEMAISKQIIGKSKTASIKYDSKQMPNSSNINPLDKLKFNLNVKAGATQKFTYTYEMYVQD